MCQILGEINCFVTDASSNYSDASSNACNFGFAISTFILSLCLFAIGDMYHPHCLFFESHLTTLPSKSHIEILYFYLCQMDLPQSTGCIHSRGEGGGGHGHLCRIFFGITVPDSLPNFFALLASFALVLAVVVDSSLGPPIGFGRDTPHSPFTLL
jgi:hypothetical protein